MADFQFYLLSGINNSALSPTGQQKLLNFIRKLSSSVEDPQDLLHDIGSILVDNTRDRINRGVDVEDRAWQKSWRAKLQGGITLRNTDRLYNAINYRLTKGGKSLAVGVDGNIEYARMMHYGGTLVSKVSPYIKFKTPMGGWAQVKSVKIPSRKYLGISVDDAQEIINIIEDHLEGVLKDAK